MSEPEIELSHTVGDTEYFNVFVDGKFVYQSAVHKTKATLEVYEHLRKYKQAEPHIIEQTFEDFK
jgi:hypothetical protein